MPKGAPRRPSSIHATTVSCASRGFNTAAPFTGSGRGLFPVGGHQRAHALRRLRALADPVIDARQIELELLLTAAGNGVEKAHVLQTRTALALAAVGHDDVIEGLVARPAPRQANGYHDRIALVRSGRSRKGRPKKSADSTQHANPAPVFPSPGFLRGPQRPGNPGGMPPLKAPMSWRSRP